MGLLDNLLNRNPTAEWMEQRGLQLVLDMDNETFCGIGIDDPVSRLEKLGPAEDAKSARFGFYQYESKGFTVTTEEGKVVEFHVTFYDHSRYAGKVRCRGQDLPAGPVKEADIVAIMGAPPKVRDEEKEDGYSLVQMEYPRTRSTWHFEFDGDGVLEAIWVGKND